MGSMPFPRRRMLGASLAGAAALGLPGFLRAEALMPTPQQTAGPFYPLSYPDDSDNDRVHVKGHAEPARGTIPHVTGRVLDRAGRPLGGARVEIWQCDDNGRYHNVQDDRTDRPRDDNFQGFGRTVTDGAGGYSFVTIQPVPYPGRTPHIHFAVAAPGLPRFVTQMYVAGEKLNDIDSVLLGLPDPAPPPPLIPPFRPAPHTHPPTPPPPSHLF